MIEPRSWPLVDAASMQALDRYTIEVLGVSGEILMESAGRAVVERVLASLECQEAARTPSVSVFCGIGNNGGDGFVVARHLHQLGVAVRILLIGSASRVRNEAAENLARALTLGVDIAELPQTIPERSVIVDAMLGTGLSRSVEGPTAEAIQRIHAAREAGAWVIAIDLPTGLDADTGALHGSGVTADETVTLGLPKPGLALEPGRSRAGRIFVARIGVADDAPGIEIPMSAWTRRGAAEQLPKRPRDGHKGSFGHVLIVAGSEGKTGAAQLAAIGAQRAGAGLVTLACPATLHDIFETKLTECMTVPVPDTVNRALAASAENRILGLAAERDVIAIGPGVGRDSETAALMRGLSKQVEKPLVIDADGLNAFAEDPGLITMLRGRSSATVLTPHPGEAARLLETSAAQVNSDRPAAALELAERAGSVVLLKGAGSLVADPAGRLTVNTTGGPLLAAGGTGDVLTGMLAAYLAQGVEAGHAATLAAFVHGAAADRLELELGSSGLLASELADAVPGTQKALRQEASERRMRETRERGALSIPFP